MERERRREHYCAALCRTVEVVKVYAIDGCGACGVSSGLSSLYCSGELECRRKGLYKKCGLAFEYGDLSGSSGA
ncbi:MAG: hypothetical protein R6V10_07870 [bacterium]